MDEQEGKIDGRKFTATVCAILPVNSVHSFRSKFYKEYVNILSGNQDQNTIYPLETLHGRALLERYSDDKKIAAVRLLLRSFTENRGIFCRQGYFDDSIRKIPGLNDRYARIQFCVVSTILRFGHSIQGNYMIVHEDDREATRAGINSIDKQMGMYYQIAEMSSKENISVEFERFLGHFIGQSFDLGCQAADISGYVALKKSNQTSPFSGKLAAIFDEFEPNYLFNDISEMKWT